MPQVDEDGTVALLDVRECVTSHLLPNGSRLHLYPQFVENGSAYLCDHCAKQARKVRPVTAPAGARSSRARRRLPRPATPRWRAALTWGRAVRS